MCKLNKNSIYPDLHSDTVLTSFLESWGKASVCVFVCFYLDLAEVLYNSVSLPVFLQIMIQILVSSHELIQTCSNVGDIEKVQTCQHTTWRLTFMLVEPLTAHYLHRLFRLGWPCC